MSTSKKPTMQEDPQNPKLLAIKERLREDPSLTKLWAVRAFEISYSCANAWEEKGWVVFGKPKNRSGSHPWRKYPAKPAGSCVAA